MNLLNFSQNNVEYHKFRYTRMGTGNTRIRTVLLALPNWRYYFWALYIWVDRSNSCYFYSVTLPWWFVLYNHFQNGLKFILKWLTYFKYKIFIVLVTLTYNIFAKRITNQGCWWNHVHLLSLSHMRIYQD